LTGLPCSQQNFPQSIAGRLPIWRHDRDRALDCPVRLLRSASGEMLRCKPKFSVAVAAVAVAVAAVAVAAVAAAAVAAAAVVAVIVTVIGRVAVGAVKGAGA